MKLKRTIHAKLILDRKGKREAVEREYDAWQRQLRGNNEQLYSATKQQAERFKRRVKKQNHRGLKTREYPIILRRDCVKVQNGKGSVFGWWIRIPISPKSIWIPIQFPRVQERLLKLEVRECKLLRGEDGEWFVNITVQKQAHLKRKYATVLPVDMGVRKLATTIENGKPCFYGKQVRTIRGHYFHLRRSVGKASVIKKWKHKEQRSVRHEVHAITRRIVDHAKQMNAVIVVGDLEGIRDRDKGRRFNRCLGSQPFYLFKQQLIYKANWEGIRVLMVSEAYTSQTCSRCGMRGQRVAGRFSCQNCGLRVDADVNGAWNIGKRAHGLLAHDAGGSLIIPRTLAVCKP
ncbi:MAG: transposase [Candidatus Bathyarchaeia archaeon]